MMFYNEAENKYIQEGTSFELNGIQYPPQWLNSSTPEEKQAIGLQEVIAQNQPYNPVYYWTGEVLYKATLTYTGTPKDLADVQKQAVSQVKQTAYTILQPTDYVEARNLRDPSYKADWMTWRDSIRQTSTDTVALINSATDVDAVATVMANIVWANDPNYVEPVVEEAVEPALGE